MKYGVALLFAALAGAVAFAFRRGAPNVIKQPDGTTLDPRRALFLETARADLGPDKDPDVYWREAGEPRLVGSKADWCGGWVLAMLHRAGLALELSWKMGIGFFSKLPITKRPLPGDLVFFEQTDPDPEKEQHQAIFVRIDGDRVHTLDGNQDNNGTKERDRPLSSVTAFYSIEPLLRGPAVA